MAHASVRRPRDAAVLAQADMDELPASGRPRDAAWPDVARLDAATLDALPDPIVGLDGHGACLRGNAAAAALLGAGAAAGAPFEDLVVESCRDTWRQLLHAVDAGETVAPTELDVQASDGTALAVDVSLTPCSGGARLVVLRDATARRQQDALTARMLSDMDEHRSRVEAQAAEIIHHAEALQLSERRLHLILESTHDAYWDWDVTARRLDFSVHFAEALGCTTGTAESVDAFLARVHPDDRAALAERFTRVETRRTVDAPLGEFRLPLADGRTHWMSGRGQVVARDESGRARRALGLLTDVTDRRAVDEERQRQQRLEAVGGLAAGVAHEINTPLQLVGDNLTFLADNLHHVTALLDAVDTLRADLDLWQRWRLAAGGLLPESHEDDLAYVRAEFPLAVRESIDGLARVSRIVRALKEFAHPGQTERARVELRHILDNAITLTRSQWKFAAEVVTDYGAASDVVLCAQGECTQLFLNLLVNAAQAIAGAGRDGKGTITVRTRSAEGCCVVDVTDTGPGIAADIQERVFDPFFTTKPVGQGTGQGLTLARAIARRHGGTIAVESAPGGGATFTVRLPLASATPSDAAA